MSDYYKKVIKDSSDNKFKEKQKYENDKEEFELKKHDHKCDKCHDDHKCHECHDDKKEKNIFTEFDVSENTSVIFPPTTGSGTATPLNTRAQVKIDVDDNDDAVLLQGTVEWTPGSLTLLEELVAILLTLSVPLGIEGTFRIWRSCDHGPFVPIFQTRDTSIISDVNIAALSVDFSTVTTSFHWVDKNPCCGDNRYYLTLDVALTSDPLIPAVGTTIVGGLLSTLIPPITVSTGTVVFTATEVENQDC